MESVFVQWQVFQQRNLRFFAFYSNFVGRWGENGKCRRLFRLGWRPIKLIFFQQTQSFGWQTKIHFYFLFKQIKSCNFKQVLFQILEFSSFQFEFELFEQRFGGFWAVSATLLLTTFIGLTRTENNCGDMRTKFELTLARG